MNSHTVFGVVKSAPFINSKSNGDCIVAEVIDRTSYNEKNNPQNEYRVFRYGNRKELDYWKETIIPGKAIYVSGIGFFNKDGKYYIAACELCVLEKADHGISVEELKTNEDDAVAYLKAEYEKLEKD